MGVGELTSTSEASRSVPVLTGQRSLPHAARVVLAGRMLIKRMAIRRPEIIRFIYNSFLLNDLFDVYFLHSTLFRAMQSICLNFCLTSYS